ncbi:MAG: HesA/MoeB/ThiF family protein [Desulfobacterales bacterium]|nr:HesA/MoeB/ThiF family protein [Desulfobacterales bacterium]
MTHPVDDIARRAAAKHFPDQAPYRSISLGQLRDLAAATGLKGRELEIAALENGVVPERYARNMRSFSSADQAALLRAQVGVVGLGGLGGAVSEVLARIGVGRLVLADGDSFEESNLNRQLLCTVARIGAPKADAARERIAEVNPAVEAAAHRQVVTAENAAALLAGCDVVVDCLDNLPSRFVLEDACRSIGCPLVSAAVAGASGHVTTIFPEDRGLRLIYGEPGGLPAKGAETALGTLPHAVVFLATLECAEVVKLLLKKGRPLRNRLLVADLNDAVIEIMNLG